MNRLLRGALVATAVVFALAEGGASALAQGGADVSSHPWIGEAAPDFSLKTVGGDALSLGDLKGQYVVVHFGASW